MLVGMKENVDVPVGIEFLRKPASIEDQVVAFRRPAFELHLRAAFHPGDVEHLRIHVARARALVQQISHQVGGQVVGVRHLLRREVVREIPIAPTPSLECKRRTCAFPSSAAGRFVGELRQLLQLLNQARPTAFTDPDNRDARVIYVMQLVLAIGKKSRHAGSRQGPRSSSPDNRDLSQGLNARLDHSAWLSWTLLGKRVWKILGRAVCRTSCHDLRVIAVKRHT